MNSSKGRSRLNVIFDTGCTEEDLKTGTVFGKSKRPPMVMIYNPASDEGTYYGTIDTIVYPNDVVLTWKGENPKDFSKDHGAAVPITKVKNPWITFDKVNELVLDQKNYQGLYFIGEFIKLFYLYKFVSLKEENTERIVAVKICKDYIGYLWRKNTIANRLITLDPPKAPAKQKILYKVGIPENKTEKNVSKSGTTIFINKIAIDKVSGQEEYRNRYGYLQAIYHSIRNVDILKPDIKTNPNTSSLYIKDLVLTPGVAELDPAIACTYEALGYSLTLLGISKNNYAYFVCGTRQNNLRTIIACSHKCCIDFSIDPSYKED